MNAFYILGLLLLLACYQRYRSNGLVKRNWSMAIVCIIVTMILLLLIYRWSQRTPHMYVGTSTMERFATTTDETIEGTIDDQSDTKGQSAYYMDSEPPYIPSVAQMLQTNIDKDPNQYASQTFKKKEDIQKEFGKSPDLLKHQMDIHITPKTNIEKVEFNDKKKPIQITVNILNDMNRSKSHTFDADDEGSYFDYIINQDPKKDEDSTTKQETKHNSFIPSWWKSKVEGLNADGTTPLTLKEIKKRYDMDVNPTKVSLYATQPSQKWNELHSYYDWLEGTFSKKYGEDKYPIAKPPVWKDQATNNTCPVVLPNTQTSSYMDYEFLKK